MIGQIHSIETFGTVDGPGIRFVVFFQGCPMRCKYCHNPDTWPLNSGTPYTAKDLIAKYERNCTYYETGGITATGGEPLLQIDFLIELFELAHAHNIHTCLDTSGITYDPSQPALCNKFNHLLAVTDYVLLDIKHMDPVIHKWLCGHDSAPVFSFAQLLMEKQIPVRIRHVIVPGINDNEEEWQSLAHYLSSLTNLVGFEILPYHTLAIPKYESLGITYPLADTPALDDALAEKATAYITKYLKLYKQ